MNTNRLTRYTAQSFDNYIINPTIKTMPNSISPPRQIEGEEYFKINQELQQIRHNEQQRLKSSQEKIDLLLNEIDKLNTILKKQTSNIHELSAKLSQTELFYQSKLQELQIQYSQEIELQRTLVREKQQEILKQNQILKQQQIELDDLYKQIENFNKESQKVKDNLKNSSHLFENQNLRTQILQLQEELQSIKKSSQEQINDQQYQHYLECQQKQQNLNQLNTKLQEFEEFIQNQNKLLDHQKIQIASLRKTVQLYEANLEDTSESNNAYQQLLSKFNQLKEQTKNQENESQKQQLKLQVNKLEDEVNGYHNIISNQEYQITKQNNMINQQQIQIDKLKTMLKNRLDEIEQWKNQFYSMQSEDKQLIKENEILKQKQQIIKQLGVMYQKLILRKMALNQQRIYYKLYLLFIDIKIDSQKQQLQYYEHQLSQKRVSATKQMSSPKKNRYQDYGSVKEFSGTNNNNNNNNNNKKVY